MSAVDDACRVPQMRHLKDSSLIVFSLNKNRSLPGLSRPIRIKMTTVPGDDLETGPLEVAVDDGVKVAHVLDEVVLGGKGFLADPAAVVPVEVVVGEELPEVVPEK